MICLVNLCFPVSSGCHNFSAYLYRSLPRMDLCFGHHISSLLALLIFGDYCFGCLFCQFIPQPSPPIILNHHLPLGITLHMQVSALTFLQCDGTGWWAFEGLVPAHRVTMESLPAVLCIFTALMAPAPKLIINYWP